MRLLVNISVFKRSDTKNSFDDKEASLELPEQINKSSYIEKVLH